MEIKNIKNIKSYLNFIKELYKNDKFYKDNKSDVIKMICSKNSPFYKNSMQEMIGVFENNEIKCQSILICHKNNPDILMISFFEARENSYRSVLKLIDYAKQKAREWDCKKIAIAINGHCNNGLGILSGGFEENPCFSECYNPSYYNDYFKEGFTQKKFVSYKNTLDFVGQNILKFKEKLSQKGIVFSHYDANSKNKDFDSAIQLYTKLNNEIFSNHSYYYKREEPEDKELFGSMKPLLQDGNFIIAKKDDKPIGFLLWYPDFNELVKKGESVNLLTLLKYKLFKNKPKNIMLTEIGVYPEYERTGLILALFLELFNYLNTCYDENCTVTSGWIYGANKKSNDLVRHILEKLHKEYSVYETNV